MVDKVKYKEPTIVRAKRGWFIALYYEYPDHPGEFKRFEISAGVNYIHGQEEKEKEIQTLLKEVKKALQVGFDPFMINMENEFTEAIVQKTEAMKEEEREETVQSWNISEGIKKFQDYCQKKNLSPNTIRTYDTFIHNLISWLEESVLSEMVATEMTEDTIQEFLNQQFDEEEWTPRTYNNHLKFFYTLFARMEKLEKKGNKAVKYVIDLSDIELKKDRAEKNRYYSSVVADKVKKELSKNENLYNYVKWIFYSCMRPREIRLLQINHIDIQARQIKATAPTAKTGDRFIPICDELMDLIKSMKLMKFPLNYYVFGGKEGKPSKEKLSRDLFTNGYKLIKDKLGLDNKYTLYGWKHTRVVNLLMAGFTDQEVMSLTGHTDYKSFMAYKRELMVDTSAMKGKTIAF